MILPGLDEREALHVANMVVARLAESNVTVSAGVAGHPAPVADRNDLQRTADRALYRAKETGKNGACASSDVPTLAVVAV
jgi:diguanylate cyclase (GGDEF)-like protein